MNIQWLKHEVKPFNVEMITAARERQAQLTKPPGALGELESIAIFLAGAQAREQPRVEKVWITIFAGDHGVAAEGVSAFPQAVTAEMIKNFSRGGAAISVLARSLGAHLEVIDLGTVVGLHNIKGVIHLHLGSGTTNFLHGAAMSEAQCLQALEAGRKSVEQACRENADLFIGGEMGIGNTTSATALACALLNATPTQMVGAGTGLDATGIARKAEIIDKGLCIHTQNIESPLDALCRLGGFEIAALTGAYLMCAQLGLPAFVDGFIATVAALTAERINPGTARWYLYGHASAEQGHVHALEALNAKPLLSLNMRLGEGSGAAVAVPLLRLSCALHNDMATFAEAAVSEKL